MTTFILTTLPPALLANDSDQADATLGQLALRLPGSIQDNVHLVGTGVAVELEDDVAQDIEPATIGFLLRAAFEEREFTAALQRSEGIPPYAVVEME
jgi:hypothetical protein